MTAGGGVGMMSGMAWEPVERWPGEAGGEGAFRSGAEPALASRGAPSPWERVRLFWFSSPELPLEHVARRAVLTSSYVYVERMTGRRERVRRAMLRGFRREGGRLIVGVVDGEDLVLPFRVGCALQAQLLAQLGGKAGERWVGRQHVRLGAASSAAAGLAAWTLLAAIRPETVRAHWALELYTSETCLRAYFGVGLALVALALLLWVPMRVRVDALGVEVRRGLVPWLPFFLPAERVAAVVVNERRSKVRGREQFLFYAVELRFDPPTRLASLTRRSALPLRRHDNRAMKSTPNAEAARLRELLRLDV